MESVCLATKAMHLELVSDLTTSELTTSELFQGHSGVIMELHVTLSEPKAKYLGCNETSSQITKSQGFVPRKTSNGGSYPNGHHILEDCGRLQSIASSYVLETC